MGEGAVMRVAKCDKPCRTRFSRYGVPKAPPVLRDGGEARLGIIGAGLSRLPGLRWAGRQTWGRAILAMPELHGNLVITDKVIVPWGDLSHRLSRPQRGAD